MALPAGAAQDFPSTTPGQGGLKLTATLSILLQRIREIVVTDAKQHDSKAYKLPGKLAGRLLLLDRGYASIRRFAAIDRASGTFITPLKSNWTGRLEGIRSGLGQRNLGKPLHDRPYRGTVDIDVSLCLNKAKRITLRVVCVSGWRRLPDGRSEVVDIWLLTNLPPEQFSADDVSSLYRYRFEIERDICKSCGSEDFIRRPCPPRWWLTDRARP